VSDKDYVKENGFCGRKSEEEEKIWNANEK
jgi:hypothetical protein